MLTVHHLNNSRSQRVLWLLEELGLPYEIKCYQRDPKTMLAPPELRRVHPLGKSPVVTDDGAVDRRDRRHRRISRRQGRRPAAPAGGLAGAVALDLLAALRRGLGDAAAADAAGVFRRWPARSPALLRPLVRAISGQAMEGYIDPQI